MKKIIVLICTLFIVTSSAFSQTKNDASMLPEEASWRNYMTPSIVHENMKKSVGEWKEEITIWPAPGADSTLNRATCMINMILGDRYQTSTHSGEFNGKPFEGHGVLAYDNAIKKYVSTWIDNMGTGIMVLEGTADSTGTIITSVGTSVDPVTKTKLNVREVFTFIDENNSLMQMYTTINGKEFKSMEVRFYK